MNDEYTGWGAVPEGAATTEESTVDETTKEDDPEKGYTTVDEPANDELLTEEVTEEVPDPLDEFKKDGKLFGRYDTELDALKAFKDLDTERGRLAAEAGQLRQALMQQQTKPVTTSPIDVDELAPLVNMLPSQAAQYQPFWDFALAEFKMQPVFDEYGNLDLSQINPADLTIAYDAMKKSVIEGSEAKQQAEIMEHHRQAAEQFEAHFYGKHPELQTIAPLVESVFNELYMSRQWTPEELEAALTNGVRERITGVAASVLGQRGGQAAAEARRVPPAPTIAGTAMGAPSRGSSEEDQYRGWKPDAIVKNPPKGW